jgi:UDP-N-acetylmuramoylalanine--D-glutamate ligase
MLAAKSFSGKRVAVMGLARSGQSVVSALKAGGAKIIAWDDNYLKCKEAEVLGAEIKDLTKENLSYFDALVLSPGIPHSYPKPHVVVERARNANIPIIGDVEIFSNNCEKFEIIGITGTNGKSTTTALVGHILSCAGISCEVGGNIGRPVLEFNRTRNMRISVLELSSYQLELAPSLICKIGVLLNISPDHLDRHGSMQGYVDAKFRIIESLADNAVAIIGVDDPETSEIRKNLDKKKYKNISIRPISSQHIPKGGVGAIDGCIVSDFNSERTFIVDLNDSQIFPGLHNQQNVAAATAVALSVGVNINDIKAGILSFKGLPHRQEVIGSLRNVTFINDSKATNADATARALGCYKSIFWIAGGLSKKGGITSLEEYFYKIKHAYLIGDAAEEFSQTLLGKVDFTICITLEKALEKILKKISYEVSENSVVLLSPAAASFDQFDSYEARGDAFCSFVNENFFNKPKVIRGLL